MLVNVRFEVIASFQSDAPFRLPEEISSFTVHRRGRSQITLLYTPARTRGREFGSFEDGATPGAAGARRPGQDPVSPNQAYARAFPRRANEPNKIR